MTLLMTSIDALCVGSKNLRLEALKRMKTSNVMDPNGTLESRHGDALQT
jgi:hypothetical protein